MSLRASISCERSMVWPLVCMLELVVAVPLELVLCC